MVTANWDSAEFNRLIAKDVVFEIMPVNRCEDLFFVTVPIGLDTTISQDYFNRSLSASGYHYFVFNGRANTLYYISPYYWKDIYRLLKTMTIYNEKGITSDNETIGVYSTRKLLKLVRNKSKAEQKLKKQYPKLYDTWEFYELEMH